MKPMSSLPPSLSTPVYPLDFSPPHPGRNKSHFLSEEGAWSSSFLSSSDLAITYSPGAFLPHLRNEKLRHRLEH